MADAMASTAQGWHRRFTVVNSHVVFREGQFGLSGFAAADIPAGTVLLSLPYNAALNELYAASTRWGAAAAPLVTANPGRLSGRSVLYLCMIGEAGDREARFYDYLTSLPQRFDDPLWWSPLELAELTATNLAAGVEFKRSWLRASYDALFPALHDSHPALFSRDVFTWERFLWAHSCFSSRGFPHTLSVPPGQASEAASAAVDGAVSALDYDAPEAVAAAHGSGPVGCMLPVLDILNHRYRTPVSWVRGPSAADGGASAGDSGAPPSGSSAAASGAVGAGAPGHVSFVAGAPIPAGAEVFNNYGPKSNEELLLSFGFVLPDNRQDTLALRFGAPPALQPLLAALGLPRRHVIRSEAGAYEAAGLEPAIVVAGDTRGASSSSGSSHTAAASEEPLSYPRGLPLYDPRIVPSELLAVERLGALPPSEYAAVARAVSRGDASAVSAVREALLRPLGCGIEIEARALHELRRKLLAKVRQLLAPPASGNAQGSGAGGADRAWLLQELHKSAAGASEGNGPASELEPALAAMEVPAATLDAAGTTEGSSHVSSYRRWMARTYVGGQMRLLLQALAHVRQALSALGGSRAPAAAAAPTSGISMQPLPCAAPLPYACVGLVPLSSLEARAHAAVTGTLGAALASPATGGAPAALCAAADIPPSGGDLLHFLVGHLLCPGNIAVLAPGLADALDGTEGLELADRFPQSSSGSASGGSGLVLAPPSFEVDRVQLALLLMVEAHKGPESKFSEFLAWAVTAFEAGAVVAHVAAAEAPRESEAATGGDEGRQAKRARIKQCDKSDAAPAADGDLDGDDGEDAEGNATPAASLESLQAQRKAQYSALMPQLCGAFPDVFPRTSSTSSAKQGSSGSGKKSSKSRSGSSSKAFSVRAFSWAMALVDALAVPLTVRGVPQLCIPPMWPRLPLASPRPITTAISAVSPGGASAQQPAACFWLVDRVEGSGGDGGEVAVLRCSGPAAAGSPLFMSHTSQALPQAALGVPGCAPLSFTASAARDALLCAAPIPEADVYKQPGEDEEDDEGGDGGAGESDDIEGEVADYALMRFGDEASGASSAEVCATLLIHHHA